MAKIPYSKLKCKINEDCAPVQIGEETIAVKQYLPIQEKLALIGRIIEWAHDEDRNHSNPVKVQVITNLEIIFNYTNITFTDKQKEDIPKLYDTLWSSGVVAAVRSAIPWTELEGLEMGIRDSIKAIYEYQNSVLGVMDTIKTDYSNMKLDVDTINQTIADPNSLSFIKDILTNLN